ncbi:P-loop containing nucleoside triphosphate hydrolase protein [Cladochytrium replicatum]|nr:P-loop containing nucleoside triphosphate hydrolase protein [Cladochytrium replicatum]
MASTAYDLLFKSCLLLRFTNREFMPSTETTIGIEFGSQIVPVQNKQVKLQIWDTAGQESFRSISRAYYRGAIGCLLSWLDDVKQHGNEEIKIVLVANKSDLHHKRQITREEGETFAKRYGLLYLETSAKTGENVDGAFESLAQHIFDNLNLSREVGSLSELELKRLEQHGVRVGPRAPQLLAAPPTVTEAKPCCT